MLHRDTKLREEVIEAALFRSELFARCSLEWGNEP